MILRVFRATAKPSKADELSFTGPKIKIYESLSCVKFLVPRLISTWSIDAWPTKSYQSRFCPVG
jgi:hypothetical protein